MSEFDLSPRELGRVLRRRRKALGRTQADVAAQAGLRQATVSGAEAGTPIELATLLSLLEALDLELMVLPRTKDPAGN